MVAFARAQAKSIFSKLRFTAISKAQMKTNERSNNEKQFSQKQMSSNYFLEAIKSGGAWLS